LDKKTGKARWETVVKEELGVSDLKLLSKNELLLFGKGYRYVDYALDKDKQAALYLIDANDGEILEKKELPTGETIINHAINDAFIYALTEGHIYRFDKGLEKGKRVELSAVYGAPLRVVTWSSVGYDDFLTTDTPDFPLVIRTMQGIVALHPVTLWVDESNEVFWFAKNGKIIGLDLLNEGATVAEFELDTDDFWYVGDGELVQFGGRDVRILSLKSQ